MNTLSLAEEQLWDICDGRVKTIYGKSAPDYVKDRIVWEMTMMRQMDGDAAQTLFDTACMFRTPCLKEPDKYIRGFRGNLGASFIAYLCDITPFNPLELPVNLTLSPAFLFKKGKPLSLHINMGKEAKAKLEWNRKKVPMPKGVTVYDTPNLNLLEALQRETEDIYTCGGYEGNIGAAPTNFYDFFRSSHIEYAPEFCNRKIARQMLSKTSVITVETLSKMLGMMHGTGTWIENAEYMANSDRNWINKAISSAEDVMDYLLSRSMRYEEAFSLTEKVRSGNGILTKEDLDLMHDYACEEWFIDSVSRIQYLFYRAQNLCYALETKRLIYYFNKYGEQYVRIFKKQRQ